MPTPDAEDFEKLYKDKLLTMASRIPEGAEIRGKDASFVAWYSNISPFTFLLLFISIIACVFIAASFMPASLEKLFNAENINAFLPVFMILVIFVIILAGQINFPWEQRVKLYNNILSVSSKIRVEIIKEVAQFFGLRYRPSTLINAEDLKKAGIAKHDKLTEINHTMAGLADGCPLEIMEVSFCLDENDQSPIMKSGLLAAYLLDKRFEGTTLLFESSFLLKINKALTSKMTRVKLEWPLFEEAFDLYTTSQVDARIVMDTDFMEAVYDFYKEHGITNLFISFYENKMLAFIETSNSPRVKPNPLEPAFKPKEYYDDIQFFLSLPQKLGYTSFANARFKNIYNQDEKRYEQEHKEIIFDEDPPAPALDMTPLIQAILNNDIGQIEKLLRSGENINQKILRHGNTALHIAAWNGYEDIVKVLLNHADIERDIKNNDRKTATDLALENGFKNIADLIKTKNR